MIAVILTSLIFLEVTDMALGPQDHLLPKALGSHVKFSYRNKTVGTEIHIWEENELREKKYRKHKP
jgi:hypothetical protein